jgi:alpha-1,2-mannosyltransferase
VTGPPEQQFGSEVPEDGALPSTIVPDRDRTGHDAATLHSVPGGRPAPDRVCPARAMRRVAVVLLVLTCLATAVALHMAHRNALVTLLPSPDMRELHVDFDTFRLSAVALLSGGDIYETPAKLTNLNPPLLAVLLAPTALLDALTGYRIFAALTLLLVVGAIVAVTRELRLSWRVSTAVVLVVLASSPLHGTLVLGQIYGLLLVGLTAGWIAERRGRPLLAAAFYGVTVALKPSLAPLLLLPLVTRRWRAGAAGVAAAAVASLLGVLIAGPGTGLEWLRIGLMEPVPDTVDNASLPGLAVRFGLPSALGTVLGLAVLAGTLVALGRRRDRVDPAGTAPWAVLAAGLLLSPIAWHNYVMLLWPGLLLLLAGESRENGHGARYRSGRATVLLAVMVIPVSWNAVWPPEAWWSAIGRSLYCAVLLAYWWVLLSSALGSPSESAAGRVADGVARESASGSPPMVTASSPASLANRGSSAEASGAPGVGSSAGGSA